MAKRLIITLASVVVAAVVVAAVIIFFALNAAGIGGGTTATSDSGSNSNSNSNSDSASDSASGVVTEDDEDFGSVEVYQVVDGELQPAASGLTQETWELFVRVLTPDFAAEVMSQYRVGDAPDSDTLAYVYQADDPDYWVLANNLATSEDTTSLIATLVHEYAHILTLTGTEMDREASSCDTIELSEGCARDDSYLLAFADQFWADYGDSAPTVDNEDADLAYQFYLEHEDDFVSDYAATNAVEDIAESFMTFVLEDEPADASASMAAAKLDFFWQYPELQAIRERIRAEFADDLGLAG